VNVKIAVSCANQRQVSGPATLCPNFWVYDTDQSKILSKKLVHLDEKELLGKIKGNLSQQQNHALSDIGCVISRNLGDGLNTKLHDSGIKTMSTNMLDPDTAVLSYLKYAHQIKV
jgi:predicted Fe-Mo cluster-binding NifX family protein